jgi:hypothetical protein
MHHRIAQNFSIHPLNGDKTMRTNLAKIALVATFGFAITFTLSCSGRDDHPDGDNGALGCKYTYTEGSFVVCTEFPKTNIPKDPTNDIENARKACLEEVNGIFYDGPCPSNHTNQCSAIEDGIYVKVYVYDTALAGVPCSEIGLRDK